MKLQLILFKFLIFLLQSVSCLKIDEIYLKILIWRTWTIQQFIIIIIMVIMFLKKVHQNCKLRRTVLYTEDGQETKSNIFTYYHSTCLFLKNRVTYGCTSRLTKHVNQNFLQVIYHAFNFLPLLYTRHHRCSNFLLLNLM